MTVTEHDTGISLEDIVINDLAFRSLNAVPHEPSTTTAEAVDSLCHWVRLAGLGITGGLYAIAHAIEESRADEPTP